MKAVLKNNNSWLLFEDPIKTFEIFDPKEVPKILKDISKLNLYAIVIISYEASLAFDESNIVNENNKFPLLTVGLFKDPKISNVLPELTESTELNFQIDNLTPSINSDEFIQKIKKIKTHISSGNTYQVNFTYRLNGQFYGCSYSFFKSLINKQDTKYSAYIDMNNWSICSVSPELFFSLEGQKLISKPMKGTIKRGVNTNDDLQQSFKLKNSEKDKAENIMIVDMIRNDLGKIPNISSINTLKKFETESFPTLWQMTSTVEAQVKQDSSEIIKAMFPCASITGAPKIKTMEIIKDLECSPRNIYTGSIGLISPNRNALFNVAIRTALIDKKTNDITYGIGSGIVWDSQEKDEYDETLLKSKIMLDQYSNFDLVETMLWTPNEKIVLQKYHLERLKKSANFFNRKFKIDKAEKLLNSFYSDTPQKIRLLLNDNNQLLIENSKFEELNKDRIIKIKLANNHINSSNIFVQHKTTNRSVYDNAKKDLQDYDDVLLWNEKQQITECTIYNIAIFKNNRWITPPLKCGLLDGIMRAELIKQKKIHEDIVELSDLNKKTKIMLFNSVRGCLKAILI